MAEVFVSAERSEIKKFVFFIRKYSDDGRVRQFDLDVSYLAREVLKSNLGFFLEE